MNYQDVRRAVREHMAGLEDEESTSWVIIKLAGKLGIDIQGTTHQMFRSREGALFAGQVRRALDQLAGEGYLVKRVEYTVGLRKEALWLRKEVAERREQEKAEREAAEAAGREQAEAVRREVTGRFARCGYEVTVTAGGVLFGPEAAGRLLDELERAHWLVTKHVLETGG